MKLPPQMQDLKSIESQRENLKQKTNGRMYKIKRKREAIWIEIAIRLNRPKPHWRKLPATDFLEQVTN